MNKINSSNFFFIDFLLDPLVADLSLRSSVIRLPRISSPLLDTLFYWSILMVIFYNGFLLVNFNSYIIKWISIGRF